MRFREAELTHGRVGMLASLGFLVQENFHPLFSADGGPAIEQIPALPPAIWFLMTLGIGVCETLRIQKGWENPYSGDGQENIQKLKADYYPGDLKPPDPAELREMQEKELSHGRLAMLAAAGFMAQEAVTGATWGSRDVSFENVLLGGYFAQESAELARDARRGARATSPSRTCSSAATLRRSRPSWRATPSRGPSERARARASLHASGTARGGSCLTFR